jgi:hypothetical protein
VENAAVRGHDDDDILGFPWDGVKDANPAEARETAEDGGDAEMNEEEACSGHGSAKKRKTCGLVPPDEFVADCIKALKDKIGGTKREDNQLTLLLTEQLCDETISTKLADDKTFKSNQQWVATKPAKMVRQMEFVGSTVRVGPIRHAHQKQRVSRCLGVCLNHRMPQSLREQII